MKMTILSLALLLVSGFVRADEPVIRDYMVKGMTCAGCVFGVKRTLERAGIRREQIVDVDFRKPDPEKKIGHAKIRFKQGEYHGLETDCRIVKAIKESLGYIAFWDSESINPCQI